MLFNRKPNQRNRVQRTIVIVQKTPRLSKADTRLTVACPRGLDGQHTPPTLLAFSNHSVNNSGQPTVIYECPHRNCHVRQIFARDSRTGKLIRIG